MRSLPGVNKAAALNKAVTLLRRTTALLGDPYCTSFIVKKQFSHCPGSDACSRLNLHQPYFFALQEALGLRTSIPHTNSLFEQTESATQKTKYMA